MTKRRELLLSETVTQRNYALLRKARTETRWLAFELAGFFDAVAEDDREWAERHAIALFGDAEADGAADVGRVLRQVTAAGHLLDEFARPTRWARFAEGTRLSAWNAEPPCESAHHAVCEAAGRLQLLLYVRHGEAGALADPDPDGPPLSETQRLALSLDFDLVREFLDGNDGRWFRGLARKVLAESRRAVAGLHHRLLLATLAHDTRIRRPGKESPPADDSPGPAEPVPVEAATEPDDETIARLPEPIRRRFGFPS
jgi:hypothetical protein